MHTFLDRYVRWLFPLPALVFIVSMMIFPLGYTLWNSFTDWSLSAGKPAMFIGFENYIKLFQDERFQGAVLRTLYFTLVAVSVEMILGIAIALFLNRDFRGKRIITSIMLLPMMATPVAIAMVWLLMFEPTAGIINFSINQIGLPKGLWISAKGTVIPSLALVDIWEWTPMIVLICLAGLTALPRDSFEAAIIEGASYWQRTWRITLPLLMPTIIVAMLLRLIDALKTFDIIYTMTLGGPGFASETLNIFTYQNAFYYLHFGYASSLLVIFFALVLGVALLTIYLRRRVEI
jgi:multiple sugar transport system permease protein